jgi:hypothetical protein
LLCHQRMDLVVAEQLLIEVKSVERLAPVHHAQVRSYLFVFPCLSLRVFESSWLPLRQWLATLPLFLERSERHGAHLPP